MTKLQPLGDKVVVKRCDKETESRGGILLPEQAKEKPSRGEVLAVGPGRRTEDGTLIPVSVRRGDLVLFRKHAGTEVRELEEDVLVIAQEDILATINPSSTS